ncbi:hypothetical protein R6Q57_024517 [Mikania cordata]
MTRPTRLEGNLQLGKPPGSTQNNICYRIEAITQTSDHLESFIMVASLRHKFLLLTVITFLAFSEATSRLPKEVTWEQMLPKKFLIPSSAPSRGTNSVTDSGTRVAKARSLPLADGKV